MTIIQPSKYKELKKLIIILSFVLAIVLLVVVFIYLQTVSAEHALVDKKEVLENLKVENADLKNEYFALIDASNLEKFAEENGFIRDKNPQWAFASPL